MILEFWNANINPITMFTKCNLSKADLYLKDKKNYISDDSLDRYILANELMKNFNVGAKRLKALFISIGEEPKFNRSTTYYAKNKVKELKSLLNEPKQVQTIDKEKYISTQELIKMFNYKDNKAFKIIAKNNITKTNFGGRINYYEKNKAISIFMKYKKN